jgi:hypothetical protein
MLSKTAVAAKRASIRLEVGSRWLFAQDWELDQAAGTPRMLSNKTRVLDKTVKQ